ncbi:hypothetical protein C0J52_04761 [Blattella germanica]|nr:hypothetical protein C0J52_04761 [Blattella germanica]
MVFLRYRSHSTFFSLPVFAEMYLIYQSLKMMLTATVSEMSSDSLSEENHRHSARKLYTFTKLVMKAYIIILVRCLP